MKCLIVDDDPLTCDMVENYLKRIGGVEFCLKVGDGSTALHLLATEQFDAIFLDLELPGVDGVSLLKAFPGNAPVVVISADTSFGSQSYEFGVVDYLVKPLEFSRFSRAVARVKEITGARSKEEPAPATAPADNSNELFLRDGNNIQRVDLSEVIYIKAESNYASFVLDSGGSLLSLVSMRKLEELLPDEFVRVHRSYIVKRSRISRIEGDRALLGGGLKIPIGQSYRGALIHRLAVIN